MHNQYAAVMKSSADAVHQATTEITLHDIPGLSMPQLLGNKYTRDSDMIVVLCVTTFKRTFQLTHALPANVAKTWAHFPSEIVWCIVDFNDPEGEDYLGPWFYGFMSFASCADHIFLCRPRKPWQCYECPVAKNTAHIAGAYVARELLGYPAHRVYLCNIDGDNLLTNVFLTALCERANLELSNLPAPFRSANSDATVTYDGRFENTGTNWRCKEMGTCGRIGVPYVVFNFVGGYNEKLRGMGYQDIDLMKRLSLVGNFTYVQCDDLTGVGFSVPNQQHKLKEYLAVSGQARRKSNKCSEDDAKMKNLAQDLKDKYKTFHELNHANLKLAKAGTNKGKFRANVDQQRIGVDIQWVESFAVTRRCDSVSSSSTGFAAPSVLAGAGATARPAAASPKPPPACLMKRPAAPSLPPEPTLDVPPQKARPQLPRPLRPVDAQPLLPLFAKKTMAVPPGPPLEKAGSEPPPGPHAKKRPRETPLVQQPALPQSLGRVAICSFGTRTLSACHLSDAALSIYASMWRRGGPNSRALDLNVADEALREVYRRDGPHFDQIVFIDCRHVGIPDHPEARLHVGLHEVLQHGYLQQGKFTQKIIQQVRDRAMPPFPHQSTLICFYCNAGEHISN